MNINIQTTLGLGELGLDEDVEPKTTPKTTPHKKSDGAEAKVQNRSRPAKPKPRIAASVRRTPPPTPQWAKNIQAEVAGNHRLYHYNHLLEQFGLILYNLPKDCDVFIRENVTHREGPGTIHSYKLRAKRSNGDLYFESPSEEWRRTTLKISEILELFLENSFYPDRASVVLQMARTVKALSKQGKYEKCQAHFNASSAIEETILKRLAQWENGGSEAVFRKKAEDRQTDEHPVPPLQERKPSRTFPMGYGRKKAA